MTKRKPKTETIYLSVEGPHAPLQITIDRAAQAVYVRVRIGKVSSTVEVEEGDVANLRGAIEGLSSLTYEMTEKLYSILGDADD